METIGITCHCGNKHAIILSQRLVECTKCTTVHNIDDVKSYTSYDITPLHVLEQRAKEQAVIDMEQQINEGAALLEEITLAESERIRGIDAIIDWKTCFLAKHEQFGVPF